MGIFGKGGLIGGFTDALFGSSPEAPDPSVAAGKQFGYNIDTAIVQQMLNAQNQVSPDGSLTYTQNGVKTYTDSNGKVREIPNYTVTSKLSPQMQKIYDQANQAKLQLASAGNNQARNVYDTLSQKFSTDSLGDRPDWQKLDTLNLQDMKGTPQLKTSYGDEKGYAQQRQRVEDALMSRLNPSLEGDRRALNAELAAQGITVGTDAFSGAMGDHGQKVNDARMSAILGAGQEQNRLAELDRAKASFYNDANQQDFNNRFQVTGFNNQNAQVENNSQLQKYQTGVADYDSRLQELFAVRNQPLNELGAMLSGTQVAQPTFQQTAQSRVGNVDYGGFLNTQLNNEQKNISNRIAVGQQVAQAGSAAFGG